MMAGVLQDVARSQSQRGENYNFSQNSQTEHEIKIPPATPRSRSFTRLTIRVGLPHLGQSVLLEVSITFLRSAVFAIFAIIKSPGKRHPHACQIVLG
jgi:hypothetical protein